jgi:hypothetical protein
MWVNLMSGFWRAHFHLTSALRIDRTFPETSIRFTMFFRSQNCRVWSSLARPGIVVLSYQHFQWTQMAWSAVKSDWSVLRRIDSYQFGVSPASRESSLPAGRSVAFDGYTCIGSRTSGKFGWVYAAFCFSPLQNSPGSR